MPSPELQNAIKEYFADKEGVIAVYLFGSYAMDNDDPLSDVDLGVLLDESNPVTLRDRRDQYMVDLGRILRKDIHPVLLNSASEELLRQIFLKGKCILAIDPKKLSQYKMVMFTRIAEFGYYRCRMQSGVIRKVV